MSAVGGATAAQRLPNLPAPKVVPHDLTMVQDWIAAVDRHTPGELDGSVLTLTEWTQDDAGRAWLDVQALIALVERPNTTRFTAQPSGRTVDISNSPGLAALRQAAATLRAQPGGAPRFFKRAALLHADVAMSVKSGAAASVTGALIVQTNDGAQRGVRGNSVHWEFGRLLLDALPTRSDDFARDWYRASMAYKLRVGDLDAPHFERATEIFPRDPIVRFLRGVVHEWLADPRVQAVSASVSLPRGIHLEVRSERAELREAEDEFNRALENDPDYVEARVRRGRVLGRLGQHKEAAAELRAATGESVEPLVAFYAHLFLGAEEEALGRFVEARAAYEAAALLFPRSQAPRLALSQLAHREGNRVDARVALAPALRPRVSDRRDDPWWTYRSAPARHTHDLVLAMYRGLDTGGTRDEMRRHACRCHAWADRLGRPIGFSPDGKPRFAGPPVAPVAA